MHAALKKENSWKIRILMQYSGFPGLCVSLLFFINQSEFQFLKGLPDYAISR
jgi:hypothetical protein